MIHSSALRFPKRPSSAFHTAKQSAPRTEYRLNLLYFKHSGRDPLESKRRKRKGLHMHWIMALVSNLILVGVLAAPQTRVPQPWDAETIMAEGRSRRHQVVGAASRPRQLSRYFFCSSALSFDLQCDPKYRHALASWLAVPNKSNAVKAYISAQAKTLFTGTNSFGP